MTVTKIDGEKKLVFLHNHSNVTDMQTKVKMFWLYGGKIVNGVWKCHLPIESLLWGKVRANLENHPFVFRLFHSLSLSFSIYLYISLSLSIFLSSSLSLHLSFSLFLFLSNSMSLSLTIYPHVSLSFSLSLLFSNLYNSLFNQPWWPRLLARYIIRSEFALISRLVFRITPRHLCVSVFLVAYRWQNDKSNTGFWSAVRLKLSACLCNVIYKDCVVWACAWSRAKGNPHGNK